MYEKAYLESAYIYSLLKLFSPGVKKSNFKRSQNTNYINKGNTEHS